MAQQGEEPRGAETAGAPAAPFVDLPAPPRPAVAGPGLVDLGPIKFDTREELDAAITDTRYKYGTCLLDHYQFCLGGLLIGLPLSIRYKSQLYWAIGAVSGTLMDYSTALGECKHYRHRSEALLRVRAGLDAQTKDSE